MSRSNVTQLPDEVLEKIFFYLDDTTTVNAAYVCKRFCYMADMSSPKKYDGSNRNKWYEIAIYNSMMTNEQQELVQHRPFILKRVSAIHLTFHTALLRYHWIHQVFTRIGRGIHKIRLEGPTYREIGLHFYNILSKTPNISHLVLLNVYPTNIRWGHQRYIKLTHLELNLTAIDEEEFKVFVTQNSQLKDVKLAIQQFRLLYAFDKTDIESMHCSFSPDTAKYLSAEIRTMHMNNLRSLYLELPPNSLNRCIQKMLEPCKGLTDLHLINFDTSVLTAKSFDILCSFSSMESVEVDMSLENVIRLMSKCPMLTSIALPHKQFTIREYKDLLAAAYEHGRLRLIRFPSMDLFDHFVLVWLMNNISHQLKLEHKRMVITEGKVQYDDVTIMRSDQSPIENEKFPGKWLQRVRLAAGMNDEFNELVSSLPMLHTLLGERDNIILHLGDDTNEKTVERRGQNVRKAYTRLSDNYAHSANCMTWLEIYCERLECLSIRIVYNHTNLGTWTFPQLNTLRISCNHIERVFDLTPFAWLQCVQLSRLQFFGKLPNRLNNCHVVRTINLFDNLSTLQIYNFNEAMNTLLEYLNENVQKNLRYLDLANRRIDGERYRMNNKTVTAIARYPNLIKLKILLPAINKTNTKYLFEHCMKLSELYIECNFLSYDEDHKYYDDFSLFADIKSNCLSLETLQLVWNDLMFDSWKVHGITNTFPNVSIKIMQLNIHMRTTAELIISDTTNQMECLLEEFDS